MLAQQVEREIWGNGSSAVCMDFILAPLGKLKRIPFEAEICLCRECWSRRNGL